MIRIPNFKFQIPYLFVVFLLLSSAAFGQSDGSQQNVMGRAGTFVIRNARIVTVSGATIENGSVLIKDGKIAAIGADIGAVPAGAETIDGKGLSVYPGMIDAATNMGLLEIGLSADPTVDVSEVGDMNANAKAIVGINPNTSHVNVTRVNGITTVQSSPGGGIISGQSAIINLIGATQAEMTIEPTHALVINFPRISTSQGFGQPPLDFNEAVKQRDRRIEDLKKMFKEVEEYARLKDAYAKDSTLPRPAMNLRLDAAIPYVRGEKTITFSAERERDIRAVAKFVEENKLKAVIEGGQDAWKAADVLIKNNISVVYTNIYALPVQNDDPYDLLYSSPAKMQKAGIKFCISTGNEGSVVRDLPYHAGLASAYGLPKDDALKSVTLYPAQILGIADKMGSLEVGKMANIVVTDGDLLEPRTNVKYLFINGRLLPLTSRHTELYEQFKDRK